MRLWLPLTCERAYVCVCVVTNLCNNPKLTHFVAISKSSTCNDNKCNNYNSKVTFSTQIKDEFAAVLLCMYACLARILSERLLSKCSCSYRNICQNAGERMKFGNMLMNMDIITGIHTMYSQIQTCCNLKKLICVGTYPVGIVEN